MKNCTRDDDLAVTRRFVRFLEADRPFGFGGVTNNVTRLQMLSTLEIRDQTGQTGRSASAVEVVCLLRQIEAELDLVLGYFIKQANKDKRAILDRHANELLPYSLACKDDDV